MYECPTTHPMSLVVNIVSPGSRQKMRRIDECERDRVAAGIALHALGLAGRSRREQNVRRLGRFEPFAGHPRTVVFGAQRRVIQVAAASPCKVWVEPAIREDDVARRMARDAQRLVDERLVGMTLPARMPASAVTSTDGRASSIRAARLAAAKPPEDDRMDGAQPRAGQHREHGLGDHRHVDQHAVAARGAVRGQHRRAGI
jgi:hypothetical protein